MFGDVGYDALAEIRYKLVDLGEVDVQVRDAAADRDAESGQGVHIVSEVRDKAPDTVDQLRDQEDHQDREQRQDHDNGQCHGQQPGDVPAPEPFKERAVEASGDRVQDVSDAETQNDRGEQVPQPGDRAAHVSQMRKKHEQNHADADRDRQREPVPSEIFLKPLFHGSLFYAAALRRFLLLRRD